MKVEAESLVTGNWEEILIRAGLDRSFLLYQEGPCPVCGGTTRFRWKANKESGFCNHCRFLSGFDLLKSVLNVDYRGACDFVREWAGYGDKNRPGVTPQLRRVARPVPQAPVFDPEALRRKYAGLWEQSVAIESGDAAHNYLKYRAPKLPSVPSVLRMHRNLDYWARDEQNQFVKLGTHPGMLALVQGSEGEIVNIWRFFLDAKGDKADVPDPKKGAGAFISKPFAVRLAEPLNGELGIAEGVETALAVTATFGIPCWSTLNAWGMANFDLPAGFEHVRKVRVFGDNDISKTGNIAAETLKERMRARGLISTVILPKWTSFDFGNVAQRVAQQERSQCHA